MNLGSGTVVTVTARVATVRRADPASAVQARNAPHVTIAPATAELSDHVASDRPHVNAESGRDFAGWFTAAIT